MSGENRQTQGCPPPPALPAKEKASKAAEIARAMGVRSCETDQFSLTANYEVNLLVASAEMEVTVNKTSTVGCEALLVEASELNKSEQNITCILNKSTAKTTINARAGNSITFKAGKDIDINCPKFVIKQNLVMESVNIAALSSSDKQEIAKVAKDTVKRIGQTLIESKTGLGATPQGAKVIKDAVENADNIDFNQTVNDSLKEISISTDAQNNITMEAGGNIRIRGQECNISQDLFLKVISKVVIQDAVEKAFSDLSEIINEKVDTTTIQTESKGAEELSNFGQGRSSRIIMLIVVVILLGVVGYFIFKVFMSPAGQGAIGSFTAAANPAGAAAGVLGSFRR
jgi:hypothetical protein